MLKIPCATWIANAAAGLAGNYGQVTQQADRAGCSRQTVYDHTLKVQAAVEAEHSGGPTRAELIEENQRLRRENEQLWAWLFQTIDFSRDKVWQFAITAAAMGLSLNQILVLLALLLGTHACPGRSTVHRRIQAAGRRAGAVLKILDRRCKALILVGCLDEIFFHGRPVLVGVEPASMTWFLGHKANDHTGATWAATLQEWSGLRYVVSDAGSGLQAGITREQERRHKASEPGLENGLDVFHTVREAQTVLRQRWNELERLWERAEMADRKVRQAQTQGQDACGLAASARLAWGKAEAAFDRYESEEAAWRMAHAALQVFRPDGQLNDRSWAWEQIKSALAGWPEEAWSKVRNLLGSENALTFLDRVHAELRVAEPDDGLRRELLRLWWLRRQWRGSAGTSDEAARHAAVLVQQVLCQRLSPTWRESYRAVSGVLRRTVRASSAVECMNSVLRMHQARHRTMSQELLNLERLYWNSRQFREGTRRKRCPYELLGLRLDSYQFWDLLQMPLPDQAAA